MCVYDFEIRKINAEDWNGKIIAMQVWKIGIELHSYWIQNFKGKIKFQNSKKTEKNHLKHPK